MHNDSQRDRRTIHRGHETAGSLSHRRASGAVIDFAPFVVRGGYSLTTLSTALVHGECRLAPSQPHPVHSLS